MGTTGRELTSAGHREKAVELRIMNRTYQAIGNALGISRQAAHKLVSKELARIRAKTEDDAAIRAFPRGYGPRGGEGSYGELPGR
jgi:hypothetical protein